MSLRAVALEALSGALEDAIKARFAASLRQVTDDGGVRDLDVAIDHFTAGVAAMLAFYPKAAEVITSKFPDTGT